MATALTLESVNLDVNQALVEETDDALVKATAYLEDYLFKILTDLQSIETCVDDLQAQITALDVRITILEGLVAALGTLNVVTVTATPYAMQATDDVILVDDDTVGGVVTIDLIAAASRTRPYPVRIKKLGSTASVIIDGNGAETIDGGLTATLITQYEAVALVDNGSNWFVV